MKTALPVAIVLLTGLGSGCAREQVPVAEVSCDAERAREAEEVAATAQSWRQLHEIFSRFATCDDGAIAEGFSESVTVLLAERWEKLSELAPIVANDPAFEAFVVRHIDESVPEERLTRIAALAGQQCPPDLGTLCQRIRSEVPTTR